MPETLRTGYYVQGRCPDCDGRMYSDGRHTWCCSERCDYQREVTGPPMSEADRLLLELQKQLRDGKPVNVPGDVATCPECGAGLYIVPYEWECETDAVRHYHLHCEGEPDVMDDSAWSRWDGAHRLWQSDWQPVHDAIDTWIKDLQSKEI